MGKRGRKPRNQSGRAHEEEIVSVKRQNVAVERQNPTEVPASRYFLRRRPKPQCASSSQLMSPWKCINSCSNPVTVVEDETNVSEPVSLNIDIASPVLQHSTSPLPQENQVMCTEARSLRCSSPDINTSIAPIDLGQNIKKCASAAGSTIWSAPIVHSRTQSLNITEFAKMLEDEVEDDPEEVQSDFDPAFDYVHEHKVKAENAPLLRKIFDKYGDIAKGCTLGSSRSLSFAFEILCDMITKLTQTNFKDVTHIVLTEMLGDVRFLEEAMKLNVGWLRERLESISQTKTGVQEYLKIKEDTAKYDASIARLDKELEECQDELSQLQKKITAMKRELVETKADADQSRKRALDIRTALDTFKKSSLVHGLF